MNQVCVPELPESVADATVAKWYKNIGDVVAVGDQLVDLETDKVMLEIESDFAGVLAEISEQEGAVVTAGTVLANISESEGSHASENSAPADSPASLTVQSTHEASSREVQKHSPTIRRLLQENSLAAHDIQGSGKGGRLTKKDVLQHLASTQVDDTVSAEQSGSSEVQVMPGVPRRVPMSRLRARVAERLNESQKNAVILTTFNEVDMSAVMALRKKYQDLFQKKHDIKLGFMSFFVKATVEALKAFPIVNAAVDGQDILYHDYFDIGVAIAAPRGLVVPVIRGADTLSMAQIEQKIKDYALQARDNKLSLDDMTGGTFTITNGGTFGSMMSTPIINPPQSGILGMHNIVKRPVVVDDNIVVRPMMYLALSYDHRIVDGSDSVRFLVTIKQLLEDPARLLINV